MALQRQAAEDARRERGPATQEEMNEWILEWDGHDLSCQEQDQLARMYGFRSERSPLEQHWTRERRERLAQKDMDNLVRGWEVSLILSSREVGELFRMYGFDPVTRQRLVRQSRRTTGLAPEYSPLLGPLRARKGAAAARITATVKGPAAKPQGVTKSKAAAGANTLAKRRKAKP